jgi:hypothetical protein
MTGLSTSKRSIAADAGDVVLTAGVGGGDAIPLLRALLGLEPDVPAGRLAVEPALPRGTTASSFVAFACGATDWPSSCMAGSSTCSARRANGGVGPPEMRYVRVRITA